MYLRRTHNPVGVNSTKRILYQRLGARGDQWELPMMFSQLQIIDIPITFCVIPVKYASGNFGGYEPAPESGCAVGSK